MSLKVDKNQQKRKQSHQIKDKTTYDIHPFVGRRKIYRLIYRYMNNYSILLLLSLLLMCIQSNTVRSILLQTDETVVFNISSK